MEALNASIVLNPISIPKKPHHKKHPSIPNFKTPKPQFNGGNLILISSVFNSDFAKALTYEEALNQSTTVSSSSFALPDFDISGIFDTVINFGVQNPGVVVGGVAVVALQAILSQVLGKGKKAWGVESAKVAYEKLGEDVSAQLVDIRGNSEIRKVGCPDVRGLKKKAISIAYNGDDKPGFLKKLAVKFKEPENTTLFILDKFDGSSELVAELVTVNGFKAAYAIKDGAEGSRGWMNSGLPWILPNKAFAFDFGGLTDAIEGLIGESSDAVSVIFGIAAATGLGLLAFSEVETILEVLGSAALVQLVTKKLLFAEDRKKTLKEVDEFVTTKIGPKDLLDEIKEIGKALLPLTVTSKALPSTTTASPETVVEPTNSAPPKVQAEAVTTPAEPTPQANSVPKIEAKEEPSPPKPTRSLSPYPNYPNLKPPTSPIPSKP